jgi:hypothetical protein
LDLDPRVEEPECLDVWTELDGMEVLGGAEYPRGRISGRCDV